MLRRLSIVLTGIALLIGGVSTSAAAATTEARHQHRVVETFVDTLPTCDFQGPRYRITTTANSVEHVTEFTDGRVHLTCP